MTKKLSMEKLRREIRPLFFSPPVQAFVGQGNRLASRFLYDGQSRDRLRALFARLPLEFSNLLLPQTDLYFEACLRGSGIGPKSYFEISRWLARGGLDLSLPSEKEKRKGSDQRSERQGRLKLLFVAGCAPSPFHGGGLMLLDMLEMLGEKHDVSLYCFHQAESDGAWDPASLAKLKSVKVCSEVTDFATQLTPWLRDKFATPFDAIHCLWPNTARLMPALREFTPRLIYQYVECITRSAASL